MKKVITIMIVLLISFSQIVFAVEVVDDTVVKNNLLLSALDQYGSYDPASCSIMWGNGLKARSAAIQYSTMSKGLKEEYLNRLNEIGSNWVTGVSSPWVEACYITSVNKINENLCNIKMNILTITSSRPLYKSYEVLLVLIKEDEFFRIDEIIAEKEFETYIY